MKGILKELWWMWAPVLIMYSILVSFDRAMLLRDFRHLVDYIQGTDWRN